MLSLVRCGDSPWERDGRLHGRTDLPLSEAGRAAVTAGLAHLAAVSIATIYHPADEAAVDTAQIVARAVGAKTKEVADLADPDLGLLEGLLEQQLAERFPRRYKQWQEDPLALVPPEGEAVADARARVFGTIARILRKSRAAEVGVVLHPIAFGLLRCWCADRPATDLRERLRDPARIERYALATGLLDSLRDVKRLQPADAR
jgi:probable phosphoglycerate mutase